jgi:hypothetical protein
VVLLAARHERDLMDLDWLARSEGIAAVAFSESDLDDQVTAIALGSGADRLCRKYPLAFSLRGGEKNGTAS